MDKLKSRKFWVCVAAMLGSIATSIAGLQVGNEIVVAIGTVCGVASAAIYAFCEAWVDQARANPGINVSVDKEVTSLPDNNSNEEK